MKTNTILVGPIGTGKSRALRTIPRNSLALVLATEPGIEAILGPQSKDGNWHDDSHHWASVLPADVPLEELERMADLANKYEQKQLAGIPRSDGHKYRQFIEVFGKLHNFKCDYCDAEFGPVDKLASNDVVAIDGLSGLSLMALHLVAGGRPLWDKPHYGLAQANLMNLIRKLVSIPANFILTAHVERRINELTGGTILTVSSVGQAIANDILKPFDEVIYTRRQGKEFFWSTVENGVDLKARRLPFSDIIKPDFSQLIQ